MMTYSALDVQLNEVKLVISGAVPEVENWSEPAQDRAILEFVSVMCGLVMKYGGTVTHGAQPTFTPVLLHQAESHGGGNRVLNIFMSELWWKDLSPFEKERFRSKAVDLRITPQPIEGDASNAKVRDAALTVMREEMISQANCFIAIGGKFHNETGFAPGVAEEVRIAQRRGMPCFLVGGFGGISSLLTEGASSASLNNLLDEDVNDHLMTSDDMVACINTIFGHLVHTPSLVKRKLTN